MGAGQTRGRDPKTLNLRYARSCPADRSTGENPLEPFFSRSISSQDSQKNNNQCKLAVMGMKPAVGKSAFISSLINQKATVTDLQQTLGLEVRFMNMQQRKIQFWEIESDDRNVDEWENIINESFWCIVLIFDEFCQQNIENFKYRIRKLQKICNENKMTGRVPIYLVGNDKLDMKISGKEKEISKEINSLYDGNQVHVNVVDFTQIKELNNLLLKIIA